MFGIDKKLLTINLEKLRQIRCAYMGVSCDCKYGKYDEAPSTLSENFSGCPEIRMARELIKAMTEDEFKDLCKRAGISLI